MKDHALGPDLCDAIESFLFEAPQAQGRRPRVPDRAAGAGIVLVRKSGTP